MVFYRKYRPQSLEQIIGQEAIKDTLRKAFSEGRLSHGYLFCGPKGTGKTSTARILAKMVNCQEEGRRKKEEGKKQDIPCNSCSSCTSITNGSSLDLIEIDAASNRGIDDIRVLRENIKLAPSSSLKKVYIIDEAHMLTPEAFNALLKTLEEPPSHVLFILATTESSKIPQTIASRLQRLDFNLASIEDILVSLKIVAEQEKIKIDEEAMLLLASKAQGSFRDGLKLLDQVSSFSEKITLRSLEQILQSGDFENLYNLATYLSKKDIKKSLSLVTETTKSLNIKEFLISLMDILRSLIFIKYNLRELVSPNYSKENYEKLQKLSLEFELKLLVFQINKLQEGFEKIKFAPLPSLPLEIAIVEGCLQEREDDVTVKLEKKEEVPIMIVNNNTAGAPDPHLHEDDQQKDDIQAVSSDLIGVNQTDDILIIKDKWNYILETIKPYNYSLEALLRSAKLLESSGGRVLLEVPYSFHQRILETPKSKDLLESVLSEVLGKQAKVKTILGKRPVKRDDIANVEIAADDEIIKLASEIFNSDGA